MPASTTQLAVPVREVAPPVAAVPHHSRLSAGPSGSPARAALLLIHGVGDNSSTWNSVHAKLAQRFTVIAPDLLGHGESDKPRADYSLAAFANGMRDLLAALGIDRVTLVGHSLGGGIAAQFAYQYPHMVERLVLVSSGGVTKDVSIALRLAAVPMGSEALAALRLPGALPTLQFAGRAAKSLIGSTKYGRDLPDGLRLLARLRDPAALSAFSRTLRAVVDGRGQFVTMLDQQLSDAIHPETNHLGRRRHRDSGEPRSASPCGDARFATRHYSKAPDICRSTTTPTDSSKLSSGSSIRRHRPNTTRTGWAR